jgi:hypothetical protein
MPNRPRSVLYGRWRTSKSGKRLKDARVDGWRHKICVCPPHESALQTKKMIEIRPTEEFCIFRCVFLRSLFTCVCHKGKGARGSRAGVDALSMVQRKSQFSLGLHCIKIQISFREQRRAHDVIKATPFSTFIRVHPHNVIFFE